MNDSERVVHELQAWFSEHELADLELPDGWFGGRAWDNLHELTYSAARPQRVLLELDEHLLLIFDGPVVVHRHVSKEEASGWPISALVFERYTQFVFDQREYATDGWSAKVFSEGSVRLSRLLPDAD